ncbi:hypothetical protein D3C77_695670 [compost metagenome]
MDEGKAFPDYGARLLRAKHPRYAAVRNGHGQQDQNRRVPIARRGGLYNPAMGSAIKRERCD